MQYEKNRYNDNPCCRVLHIKGTHAGESTVPYLHHSRTCTLLYYKHGTGSIKIEGRHYRINEGDIIMVNPLELFQISVDNEAYHERITVALDEMLFASHPDAVESLFASFRGRKKGVGNRIPSETVRQFGIDVCLDELLRHVKSSEPTSALLAFCKAAELLVLLNEAAASGSAAADGQALSNPLIGDVLAYLNLHFAEDIDIPGIAAEFSIDKSYLSHLFKEYVGMSLWTYIILRRIQLFNSLMREDGSMEENCYRAGFRNYSNFFRLYKKYMGITPTQYKKQAVVKPADIRPRARQQNCT